MKNISVSRAGGVVIMRPVSTQVRVREKGVVDSPARKGLPRLFFSGNFPIGIVNVLLFWTLIFSFSCAVIDAAHAENETLQVLNDTAVSLYEQGQYDDAAELAERALKIAQDTLGPENPQVVPFLNNLGVIYYAQGKYADAAAIYEQAIRMTEPSLGSDHQRVVYLKEGLAKCKQKMSEQISRKESGGRAETGNKTVLPATTEPAQIVSPTDSGKTPEEAVALPLHPHGKIFTVQVGAFRNLPSARELQGKLQKNGYDAILTSAVTAAGDPLHRVQVGEFAERKKATKLAREIRTLMERDVFVTTK